MGLSESNCAHKVNDYVVYRNNGVCEVFDICKADYGFGKQLYYLLKSVFDENTKYYVPADSTDGKSHIRQVMSKKEIDTVISDCESFDNEWIEDSKERTEKFDGILKSGNRAKILWLVKVLSLHKKETELAKKKFYANDERILNEALKIITEEFAFALGIGRDDVIGYITDRIDS